MKVHRVLCVWWQYWYFVRVMTILVFCACDDNTGILCMGWQYWYFVRVMTILVFCACDDNTGIFCTVRTVKKFDSRLIINETSNKCRPLERKSYSDRGLFFTGSVFSSRPSSRVLKVCPEAVQVNCIPLSKEYYIYPMHGIQSLSGAEVLTDRDSNATSPLVGIFTVFRRI
jgi:hypothetical protein